MVRRLWHGGERHRPTRERPRRVLTLHTPHLGRFFVNAGTFIGRDKLDVENDYDGLVQVQWTLIVLGFGVNYYVGWNTEGKCQTKMA